MNGVRRIYQQTFVDTYAKVAFAATHYTSKTPLATVDLLNIDYSHFMLQSQETQQQTLNPLSIVRRRNSRYALFPRHANPHSMCEFSAELADRLLEASSLKARLVCRRAA
jgi:hypothetical protein